MSAQMIQSLSEIKADFKVNNLISALEENLKIHKVDYAKALKVWQNDVLTKLEELFQEYDEMSGNFTTCNIPAGLGFRVPVNCESGYIQLINVFKNITTEIINLEISEANNILNDDWSWAQAAKLSNSFYSSRA